MLRGVAKAGAVWLAAACATGAPPARHAEDHVLVKFARAPDAALPGGAALRELGFARWRRAEVRAGRQADFSPYGQPLACAVPKGWTATGLVAALRARGDVAYAEPDFIGEAGAFYPDDPAFTNQWHLFNWRQPTSPVPADIRMPDAWSVTTGATNIILAILDTGLNTNLAEFAGRTVPGYDFVNGDSDPYDGHVYGHGSTVASVAAANAGNGMLGAGVNQGCRLMPIKVLNDSTAFGYYSDWAAGIEWAVTSGARVINLSAGGFDDSATLSNAIMSAIGAGVVFVTITHNDAAGSIRFPGRMEAAITVGATDSNDQHAAFSNFGAEIDLVAPGRDLATSDNRGSNVVVSGTSFSAPQVSAVAALLLGLRPELTQEGVRALLCAGADDQVGVPAEDITGFDVYHGWGRLNAYATLQLAQTAFDRAEPAGGQLALGWAGPSNASNRQPYVVEWAPAPAGPWTNAAPAFAYTPTGVVAGLAGATGAVFRVTIPQP